MRLFPVRGLQFAFGCSTTSQPHRTFPACQKKCVFCICYDLHTHFTVDPVNVIISHSFWLCLRKQCIVVTLNFLFLSLFSQLYSEARIKTKHGTKHQRWCQTCSWFVLVWTRAWAGKHVAFSPLFTFSSYTKRKFSKVNQNAPPDKFQIIWIKQRRS